MELFRPDSASALPDQIRVAHKEEFSLTDAALLKSRLQALNDALCNIPPGQLHAPTLRTAEEACEPSCQVYVDGTEEFYLAVKCLPRPQSVPDVYVEAYISALQGRTYCNQIRTARDAHPNFSQIRPLLRDIDRMCNTNLEAAYRDIEDNGIKPFPFLRLPAELRLHVYSYLLPREPHIALLFLPATNHKSPRLHPDVMYVSRQLYDETTQYFFEQRTLFMLVARDDRSLYLSNEFMSRYYETLATIGLRTRRLFKTVDMQVDYLANQTFLMRRYVTIPSVSHPMQHIFSLLPNLETLIISLGSPWRFSETIEEMTETIAWLLNLVPQSVRIIWDFSCACSPQEMLQHQPLWEIVQGRGSIRSGAGVTAQLTGSDRSLWEVEY